MKEFLLSKGFTLTSQCSCGGTFRQTFRQNIGIKTYEVILMPNRGRFELRYNYKVIAKGANDELEQKLKENEVI